MNLTEFNQTYYIDVLIQAVQRSSLVKNQQKTEIEFDYATVEDIVDVLSYSVYDRKTDTLVFETDTNIERIATQELCTRFNISLD